MTTTNETSAVRRFARTIRGSEAVVRSDRARRAPTRQPASALLYLTLVIGAASSAYPAAARADGDRWFGPDKALHFGVSSGLAAGSYAGAAFWLDPPWQRAAVAVGFTLSLGVAKEVYDATTHGDASLRDLTWDAIGCAVTVGLAYLIDNALRNPRSDVGTSAQRTATPYAARVDPWRPRGDTWLVRRP